jgi:hypothetical protein
MRADVPGKTGSLETASIPNGLGRALSENPTFDMELLSSIALIAIFFRAICRIFRYSESWGPEA